MIISIHCHVDVATKPGEKMDFEIMRKAIHNFVEQSEAVLVSEHITSKGSRMSFSLAHLEEEDDPDDYGITEWRQTSNE